MQLHLIILLLTFLLQNAPTTYSTGDKLPSCTFVNASSEVLNTDSLTGNILVIDYWASWNTPSRKHNLELLKLYEKYRVLNFRKKHQIRFISVSLDTQLDLWLIARAKDDLHWPVNCCDFKGWESDMANQLKITRLPSNFVVDMNGMIVNTDCWGTVLDSTLTALNNLMPN